MGFKSFWDQLSKLGINLPDPGRIEPSRPPASQKNAASNRPARPNPRSRQSKGGMSMFDLIDALEAMYGDDDFFDDPYLDKSDRFVGDPDGDRFWVPENTVVTIGDYTIASGMIYVGEDLSATHNTYVPEHSLIRPSLPLAKSTKGKSTQKRKSIKEQLTDRDVVFSYTDLSPEERTEYLKWLAEGRIDPTVPLRFVVLFYCGLERRIFYDLMDQLEAYDNSNKRSPAQKKKQKTAQSPSEREDPRLEMVKIVAEIQRLQQIYGKDGGWFHRSAPTLIAFCQIICKQDAFTGDTDLDKTDPDKLDDAALRIMLGQMVKQQQPIPADWAFAWYMRLPRRYFPSAVYHRRTPEIKALFTLNYQAKFGAGLTLSPIANSNANVVLVDYLPASPTGGGELELGLKLPDITSQFRHVTELGLMMQSCVMVMEPFVRAAAKAEQQARTTHLPTEELPMTALALLPPELYATHGGPVLAKLRADLSERFAAASAHSGVVVMPTLDLFAQWMNKEADATKITKTEATKLSQVLQKLGYGMEPDPSSGGATPAIKGYVALYHLPTGAIAPPTENYSYATDLAWLAIAVASGESVPSPQEQQYLITQLEQRVALSVSERSRLNAYLQSQIQTLQQSKSSLRSLKTRATAIPISQRADITHLLIRVAAADGQLSPAEVKQLEKVYQAFEIDLQTLYSDIHTVSTTAAPTAAPKSATQTTAKKSNQTRKKRQSQDSVDLDLDLIQSKITESQEISGLLAEIFTEEEDSTARSPVQPKPRSAKSSSSTRKSAPDQASAQSESQSESKTTSPTKAKASKAKASQPKSTKAKTAPSSEASPAKQAATEPLETAIAGLDPSHSAFLRALTQKTSWQRGELQAIATQLRLMLDGALEVINEAAFEAIDEALTEGDNPIEVNPDSLAAWSQQW
jgi:tellurite resistance protein